MGQCPLLELDDGRLLADSNAILVYLAEGTPFLPADPFERAQTLRWMFFEQNQHEGSVAVRRSLTVYPERAAAATTERMALTLANGNKALGAMETHPRPPVLRGTSPTVADIALYPYTASAPEGGFDLAPFPGRQSWLARDRGAAGLPPARLAAGGLRTRKARAVAARASSFRPNAISRGREHRVEIGVRRAVKSSRVSVGALIAHLVAVHRHLQLGEVDEHVLLADAEKPPTSITAAETVPSELMTKSSIFADLLVVAP